MGIKKTNSQKQRLPTKSSTVIKPTNTTQNRPCSNRRKRRQKKTWTTFTYYSPQIRKITNLFKHTNIGIAFRNTNTLHQLTKSTILNQTPEHDISGVHKLTCNICHRSYIGQTSRSLKLRFQENTRYIKHNESQSAYALHILNCKHEYGTISDIISLLKHVDKPSLLLPYGQTYVQLFYHNNQRIPEQHPNEQNPMFQLLHNRYHTSHSTWHLNQYFHLTPA